MGDGRWKYQEGHWGPSVFEFRKLLKSMPTVVSVQVPFFLQIVTLKSNSSPSENLVFADLQWLKCNTLSTRRGQLNRDFQLKD